MTLSIPRLSLVTLVAFTFALSALASSSPRAFGGAAFGASSGPLAVRGFQHARRSTKYGAGVVANADVADVIIADSTLLTGDYYIQNYATSKYLYWTIHPQTITATSSTAGTNNVMTLSTFSVGTRIHPQASNGKCLAAQFSGTEGVDNAATMYLCATTATVSHDAGNPQAKQQWHFLPVSGKTDTYYIIPEDHLTNMETRALSTAVLTTAGGYLSTAIALYDTTDTSQMWVVTKV